MSGTNRIAQAKADNDSLQGPPGSGSIKTNDWEYKKGNTEENAHLKLAADDLNGIGPQIPSDGRSVYYIIDSESLRSGNATINIKDKTAEPGPLGLLGFGLTTFLLNLANAGAFPMNSMVLAMGLCYGGAAQILAGIFEFIRGNQFGMIAFMSYGFFWWSLVFLICIPTMGYAPGPNDIAMGCYLFIWGIFTLIMFVATLVKKTPWMLSFVFLTVVLLFALLASEHWSKANGNSNTPQVAKAAGVEGIICGLSAIYMAAAEILNGFAKRTILWVGPRQ